MLSGSTFAGGPTENEVQNKLKFVVTNCRILYLISLGRSLLEASCNICFIPDSMYPF